MSAVRNMILGFEMDPTGFVGDTKKIAESLKEVHGVTDRVAMDIAKLETKLQKQAATFGMSSAQIKIYELELKGIPSAALASVKALDAQIHKMEELRKEQDQLAAKGKTIFDGTRTGLERHSAQLGELVKTYKSGAISAGTLGRALAFPAASIGVSVLKATAAAIVGVGVAAVGAAVGLGVFLRSNLKVVDDAGDAASRIGLSVEMYGKLRTAFQYSGSEADDLDTTINKLNLTLADAATGSGPAADALRHLGLSGMTLINLRPDQALGVISDKLAAISNPAERAGAAMDIFGKSSVKVLNTLSSGSAAITRLGDSYKVMGLEITAADAALAGDANDAVDKVLGVFAKLGQKITVGFAPHIISLGNSIMEWAEKSIRAGDVVDKVLAGAGDAIKKVIEYASLFASVGAKAFAVVTGACAVTTLFVAGLAKTVQAVINLIPGMGATFGDTIEDIGKDLGKLTGATWEAGNAAGKIFDSGAGDKAKEMFDNITAGAKGAAVAIDEPVGAVKVLDKMLEDLSREIKLKIETEGLDELEQKILKLTQAGATEKQVKGLRDQSDVLKAKQLPGTPMETYQKKMGDLDRFQKKGLIKPSVYLAERSKAREGLGFEASPSAKYSQTGRELQEAFRLGIITQKEYQSKLRTAWSESLGSTAEMIKTPSGELRTGIALLADQLKAGLINQSQYNSALQKVRQSSLGWIEDAIRGPLGGFRDRLRDLNAALASKQISKGDYQKAGKQLASEAFPDLDKLKSPTAHLIDYVTQLKDGMESGLISKDQAGKLYGAKKNELMPHEETHATAAMDISSKEAHSAVVAYNTGGNKNKGLDDVAKNTRDQLIEQRTLNRLLTQSNNAKPKMVTLN